jgi:hypothetical protein
VRKNPPKNLLVWLEYAHLWDVKLVDGCYQLWKLKSGYGLAARNKEMKQPDRLKVSGNFG